MINDRPQLMQALLNLALTQRSPRQTPAFQRPPPGARRLAGSVFKADRVPFVSVVFLALSKQEGLNDKIKNFSENHLYSRPAPELDSLYPSSAEGHGLPSSICKASARQRSVRIPRRGGDTPGIGNSRSRWEAASFIAVLPISSHFFACPLFKQICARSITRLSPAV